MTTSSDAGGVRPTGTRVARLGTVSFTRSGFARIQWDDGTRSDEWAADLAVSHPDAGNARRPRASAQVVAL